MGTTEWRGTEEEARALLIACNPEHEGADELADLLRRAVAHGYRLGVREHGGWYSTEERADAIEAGAHHV